MESARRWSGYVCPDCRFVFRVPRDHDGKGIVCPSCRRMLKIPGTGDTPPPLLAAIRRVEEEVPAEMEEGRIKRRKKGRRKGGEDHSWESQPGRYRSSGRDGRQMSWFLVVGAFVLCLVLGGVLYILAGSKRDVPVATSQRTQDAPERNKALTEAEWLTLSEAATRRFLDATTVDELISLVRHPEETGGRMRKFYPDGKVEPIGLLSFNSDRRPLTVGQVTKVQVLTGTQELKAVHIVKTPAGPKIDWESWTGWSEMNLKEFTRSKPADAREFRVVLGEVAYYNFGFSDDKKWKSYRFSSPDGEASVYGYAEKEGLVAQQLRECVDAKNLKIRVMLRFPQESLSDNQVEIVKVLDESWVENAEEP